MSVSALLPYSEALEAVVILTAKMMPIVVLVSMFVSIVSAIWLLSDYLDETAIKLGGMK